jgi:hypothetical protein
MPFGWKSSNSNLAIPLFMGGLVMLLVRLTYVRKRKRYAADGYDVSGMSAPAYLKIFAVTAAAMYAIMYAVRKFASTTTNTPTNTPCQRGGGGGMNSDSDSIVGDMLNYIDRAEAPF